MKANEWDVTPPVGEHGKWKIVKEMPDDFAILRCQLKGRPLDKVEYTRLLRNGEVIMSNTPAELRDLNPVTTFSGRVLVTGLGLGLVVGYLLCRESRHTDPVTTIDVIEKDKELIQLIGGHYEEMARQLGKRIKIHRGDALTMRLAYRSLASWQGGKWDRAQRQLWDYAWHDIWDNICIENLTDMARLHRRFGSKVVHEQHSWCRYECERARREDMASGWL